MHKNLGIGRNLDFRRISYLQGGALEGDCVARASLFISGGSV